MKKDTHKPFNFLKHPFKKKSFHSLLDPEEDKNTLLDSYILYAQHHPDTILVFSLDGKLVSGNQHRINTYLGYRARQNISFKKFVILKSYRELITAYHQAVKRKVIRMEIEVCNKKGEKLDVIASFGPIETTSKEVVGVYLLLEDVTDQKKLDESNQLKKKYIEQTEQIVTLGSWYYLISEDAFKCSQSVYTIFGFKESDEISVKTLLDCIFQEDYHDVEKTFKQASIDGVAYSTEFRIHHRATKKHRYLKLVVSVEKKDEHPVKLVGVVKDITEKVIRDMQLIETKNSYQYIFDNLNVGIWMKETMEQELTYASKGMKEIFQIPLQSIYANKNYWRNMVLPKYRDDVFQNHESLKIGKTINQQYQIKDGNGVIKWLDEQSIPRVNNAGEITQIFGMITDITSEMELLEKHKFIAKNDPITSLPNHSSLEEKMDELIQCDDTKAFALYYMSIDNFSWTYNYLGYRLGNSVLRKMTSRLISILPEQSYLARIDNAVILIIEDFESRESIFKIADHIIDEVKKEIIVEGYELHFTGSIGISFYPDNGDDKLTLLETARTALHNAHHLGNDRYQVYSHEKDISTHKKYMLDRDLRKAILGEELEVYYQPQVNPKTEVIEGAEALIRWNHQEWGLVPPNEFISIAEEKHLIHDIGYWVIRTVCKQLHRWKRQGYPLHSVAINISPIQLLKPGLVDVIKQETAHYEIPTNYLELEITEQHLIKNEKFVLTTFRKLREIGVRISLDDFGTGYSSFSYLQKFEFDTLKIDQSFIQNLELEKNASIVSSFLHLANGLNMKIVAEGVEEYSQLEFLKQKECDMIQGYLYSKPVPAKQYEQLIKNRYLKPTKQKHSMKPEVERRKYFRFRFPNFVAGKMNIIEVSKRKVDLGGASILLENLSLGGIRMLSSLSMPIHSNFKLSFEFQVMNETFNLEGVLIYKNEEQGELYSYGVSFVSSEAEKDRLVEIINKMTVLRKRNETIPGTPFIEENPYVFLNR